MSFRTRLTSFFALIVVIPMVAVAVLVFRLISDSQQGKADSRASGLASAASSLYYSESATARNDAQTIARTPQLVSGTGLPARVSALETRSGLAEVELTSGQRTLAEVGNRTAIAPGTATAVSGNGPPVVVIVSEIRAGQFVRDLAAPGVVVVVDQGSQTLGATLPAARGHVFPRKGTVDLSGAHYRAASDSFNGFNGKPVTVTVLSNLSSTAASLGSSRAVAGAFIAAFLLLAFSFSVLASRALQGQLSNFLDAARRLSRGNFSSPVPTQGRDEFAALGREFNNMSEQLARRLDELSQERARLRESIRRIGQTFASNLDRQALLDLAMKTAMDAVQADRGRLSIRPNQDEPLAVVVREGAIWEVEDAIHLAEGALLKERRDGEPLAEATTEEFSVAAVSLGPLERGARSQGVITVARRRRPFTSDDRDVLRSLAAQATLALENIELHFQVQRQAVTDELTGLANHGRFQEVLNEQIEQVRRYQHPLGLILLDLDDFKAINDTHGHQQGDIVLRYVARVLVEKSRETDFPARYGGEELAVILPHTDVEGAHAIAERVRTSIEALRIPRIDDGGVLRITASVGVASSTEGLKDPLIADADAALYEAKRNGKNRTVRGPTRTAKVFGAG